MNIRLKTLNEVAAGLTNKDGRRFITTYLKSKTIKGMTRGETDNWFFIVDTEGFYYSLPYRNNDCKACFFGDTNHYLECIKEKERRVSHE